ncbi:oxygen-independent coproporphyrinogen III oxidase [Bordetella holmesii]|uniref:Coproporphyrinogen-III oxidase n=1 Tax=Bordetella holmesii CDC-H585-BH TaxID=1331206 RepID=A0A158M428_9BORD|nr:oxygen-independent coproporphyrinogen III oxidase [Bordetella holmesii]EWM40632.1 oxygen-independent coproporphyrinogen III oxidase [Bordetella holmesii 35009]EWM43348.1 oxygen-independent coproporphyrinogen III oxidase [Bordetella holmesii 41130]AMD46613.1 coproporphyrinogen III oxidase [Bordetella holmesii H558]AOB35509.1 oxygen-independent coproporphyrinogen III oxidase [Bordetella holmesii]AUL22826.1 oxygen-independent coproporphyrinogen III oxidase [Bordetella holmesii]
MPSHSHFKPDVLAALAKTGPRYTSYPTADRLHEGFGPEQWEQALGARDAGQALSLYVHIPFCDSVCYYCACNKVVTRHHERAARYLAALAREMAMQAALLANKATITQLHFGGGTPTFLSDAELTRLMDDIRRYFHLSSQAEISIEIDPRTVDAQRLDHLAQLGFNRLSYGVQDFDPAVQQAIHRIQPYESVRDLMLAARDVGFASVNVDLIYGLPRQTAASFARTVEQVNALRPDRIALYAYAHLPTRFKPQRRIVGEDLPDPATRVALLAGAIKGFMDQGYIYIGMDHFALPADSLARACAQGSLHRNFQGYTTEPDRDLLGIGVSAISQLGRVYSQNHKDIDAYYEAIDAQVLPVERGLSCSDDDLWRRRIIMDIMCRGHLDLAAASGQDDPERVFARELPQLRQLQAMGLLQLADGCLTVMEQGWFFVRAIAMVFDAHLRTAATPPGFSRIA